MIIKFDKSQNILLFFLSLLGFLAPDKIDSKFFDPKHAFKEVEVQVTSVSDLIPSKKPKACPLYDGTAN